MLTKSKRAIQESVWVYKSHDRALNFTEIRVPQGRRVLGEAWIQIASLGRRLTQQRDGKIRGYFRINYLLGKLRVHLA